MISSCRKNTFSLRKFSSEASALIKHTENNSLHHAIQSTSKTLLSFQYNEESVPSYLLALDQETRKLFPHRHGASVGHEQGRFLAALSRLKKPRRVLELGCFTGYSALCLAEGMDLRRNYFLTGDEQLDDAVRKQLVIPEPVDLPLTNPATVLVTCDINPEFLDVAQRYFHASPFPDKLFRLHNAKAETVLEMMCETREEPFDLIFVDANKKSQSAYYEAILKGGLLASDGLMILDNMLYKKNAIGLDGSFPHKRHLKIAESIRCFSESLSSDARINYLQLPLFDGIGLVQLSSNKSIL